MDRSSYVQSPFCSFSPPYRHDYYVCTNCGSYSCGGIYSSICTKCDGVISNPPRPIRLNYLCTKCARLRPSCTCDRQPTPPRRDTPSPPPPSPIYRPPAEYCWCSCCTCCRYSCSFTYLKLFCECLSSPCTRYEPCCYCTRICCPKQFCCRRRRCFWSCCPWSCSQPSPYP